MVVELLVDGSIQQETNQMADQCEQNIDGNKQLSILDSIGNYEDNQTVPVPELLSLEEGSKVNLLELLEEPDRIRQLDAVCLCVIVQRQVYLDSLSFKQMLVFCELILND